jgi:hypothetical protein
MFGKEFKDEDTESEMPAVPKTEAKKPTEKVSDSPSKVDVDLFIESVKESPEDSAVLEGCDVEVFNKAYTALKKVKLHNQCVWDSENSILKYK